MTVLLLIIQLLIKKYLLIICIPDKYWLYARTCIYQNWFSRKCKYTRQLCIIPEKREINTNNNKLVFFP